MCGFFAQFLRHPRSVGAVAPSGKNLALKMTEPIDFDAVDVIVEYGPGTGAFTRRLAACKRAETVLICIEKNKAFYDTLVKEFAQKEIPNLHIVHGDVADAAEILAIHGLTQADCIVSGLPFTSLPKETSVRIFGVTQKILGAGNFITFQYTKVKQKFFEAYFNVADILRVRKNLPPAYVYVLKNKNDA